jgi:AAA+ ATPase superfamily predicted ATPase
VEAISRDFIGREEEIEKIRNFVTSGSSNLKLIALFGLPVVGKSALALRLLSEFSPIFPGLNWFKRNLTSSRSPSQSGYEGN